uniref:TIL domain-containing protein n=1 Tax=Meloidogyne hapla TaxID=6305 RepID=A0A1I8BKB0_MELHA
MKNKMNKFIFRINSYNEDVDTTLTEIKFTTIHSTTKIKRVCLPNEIYVECTKPSCEPTCYTIFNETVKCNANCGPPGCQCKPGTVRSEKYCVRSIYCHGR